MAFVDYAKVGKILGEKLGLERRSTWRNEWGIGTKSDVSKLLDAHLCSSLLAYLLASQVCTEHLLCVRSQPGGWLSIRE